MARLLAIVVLVVVVVWLVRRALGGRSPEAGDASGAARDELVRCARCGVHLPLAESRRAGGQAYCSDEHARLGPMDG